MAGESKDKIRVGVVGAGGIANGFHIPSFMVHPNTEIVAICDVDEARARDTANRYNVPKVYTKYEELFQTYPFVEIAPAYKSFAFSNPTIRILDIRQ